MADFATIDLATLLGQGLGDVENLTPLQLQYLRDSLGKGMQNAAASREHQDFSRDLMHQHPYLGLPTLLAAVPAYTLAKYLGVLHGRSDPGLDEMASGYRGMWQGLMDNTR